VTARDSAYRDHPLRAYTLEEAADILSCEPGWLEELARQRKIPYTDLSGTYHFTSTQLAAIESAFEVLPTAGEPSQAATPPPPAELAHTADQAAAIIGGTCKGSWLKEQARVRKIPYTRIGGALHFTDEQLAEILRISEVRPREVTPARAPRSPVLPGPTRNPVLPEPVPGREPVILQARPPRRRGNPRATSGEVP
jgi:hypothetical protein